MLKSDPYLYDDEMYSLNLILTGEREREREKLTLWFLFDFQRAAWRVEL